MEPKRIVVRKYGNRRLYNTAASRYINLEDLKELVRAGSDVQVVDAKTGEDLTRLTLTQIIVEDAKGQDSGLPLDLLRHLIITSNKVAHEGFMWFKPALNAFEGALESSLRKAGATALSPLQMVKNLVGTPTEDSGAELAELKRRIEELESNRRPKKAKQRRVMKKSRNRS